MLWNNFTVFAKQQINQLLEDRCEPLMLWRLADVAHAAGDRDEADAIYRQLAVRKLESPEDYLYGGLSEQRLNHFDKAIEIFEVGQKRHPEVEYLHNTHIQACCASGSVNRYIQFFNDSQLTKKDSLELIRDFAREIVFNDNLLVYVFNYQKFRLNTALKSHLALDDAILFYLRIKPQNIELSKNVLFWMNYIEADSSFVKNFYEITRDSLSDKDLDMRSELYILEVINGSSLPQVLAKETSSEKMMDQFILDTQYLLEKTDLLNEPISDMPSGWAPWVGIFCLASHRPYHEAISIFEQFSVKTWPKLSHLGVNLGALVKR